MGEEQHFLGFLPWNTSCWALSCHFLIVLSNRAASLWNSCLAIFSEAQALPVWKGNISGSLRQLPNPCRRAHLAFTRLAKRAARWTNTYRTFSELSAAFLFLSCEWIFPMSYYNTRAGWKGRKPTASYCALPSCWKETCFPHTKPSGWDSAIYTCNGPLDRTEGF